MAKDTSLTNPGKRKKLSSNVPVHAEEMLETKVKKKKKKMEVEEAPVIPPVTITTSDRKQKKIKKIKQTEEAPVIPPVTITTSDRKQKKIKKIKQTEEAPVIPHVTITTSDGKQKKKKTKQTEAHELEGEEDLSPEEKRVLERKMKKILKKEAKKRLKSEAETVEKSEVSGPNAPQQALDYLTCWAKKRTEWKFQKTRQTWLLQHMFDFAQIPDKKFSVLLQYMEGLQGGAKDTTVKKALALVEESGQAPEDGALQQRAHRAREVIQLLS